jgi:hypothetical protein
MMMTMNKKFTGQTTSTTTSTTITKSTKEEKIEVMPKQMIILPHDGKFFGKSYK